MVTINLNLFNRRHKRWLYLWSRHTRWQSSNAESTGSASLVYKQQRPTWTHNLPGVWTRRRNNRPQRRSDDGQPFGQHITRVCAWRGLDDNWKHCTRSCQPGGDDWGGREGLLDYQVSCQCDWRSFVNSRLGPISFDSIIIIQSNLLFVIFLIQNNFDLKILSEAISK